MKRAASFWNIIYIICKLRQLYHLLLTWFNFNPSMDNYIHYKVWGDITYSFLNSLGMDK